MTYPPDLYTHTEADAAAYVRHYADPAPNPAEDYEPEPPEQYALTAVLTEVEARLDAVWAEDPAGPAGRQFQLGQLSGLHDAHRLLLRAVESR